MKVVDEEGKPIIAATVLVANTTNGTLTDENGNFTLEVGSDQSIQVAYIGMSTVTMSVKDCLKKADQTIVLTESDTKKYVKVVASAPQTVVSDDQTFSVVEQMPEYPGGMRAWSWNLWHAISGILQRHGKPVSRGVSSCSLW